MSLTPEQIRQREYLQRCVDEVRSKKYIVPLVEELNYLPSKAKDIALKLAKGESFVDIQRGILVIITANDKEKSIIKEVIDWDYVP